MEEAKKLGIATHVNPWMFKYGDLGWGYRPSTQEQMDYLLNHTEEYDNEDALDWIVQMEKLTPNINKNE